jgi:hypothetical protein
VSWQPEEPLECIDELTYRMVHSPDVIERLVIGGRLGLAWLERYEREGDEEAFGRGVDLLRSSIAGAPGHPDRTRWFLGLGLGYAERGRRQSSIVDYHEAMNWLSALYVAAPVDSAERVRAGAVMGELGWERYWLVRHLPGVDTGRALAEVERLLARVGPFLTAPADPADLTDVRLIIGYTCLEKYELTGDPVHLVRGADLLAVSVWDLASSDPRRCEAGSELVDALRQLWLLTDDPAVLDRAVAAAVRTRELASPVDGMAWLLLHRYGASAAYSRWVRRSSPDDLELAFRFWQPLLHLGMDPASARECAAVLRAWEGTTADIELPPPS